MGEIADELRSIGGYHLGVIPRFMEHQVFPEMSEVIWTDTMAERKALLRKDTCAVVALPGGIGTLDEVIEVFALVHLKQYSGKVIVLNHNGFYEPFRALLRHYVDMKMMTEETFSKIIFADSTDVILNLIQDPSERDSKYSLE